MYCIYKRGLMKPYKRMFNEEDIYKKNLKKKFLIKINI